MSFQILYFYIPLLAFLVRPLKDNNLYAAYILILAILSYDNVTDFLWFYNQFEDIATYGYYTKDSVKGLEYGWSQIYHIFSFTKYGFFIIHSVTFFLVILAFLRFSSRLRLLNVSIFLCFALSAFTKHDNIMRQNIAIIIGYYIFFYVLEKPNNINMKQMGRIIILSFLAFLFHYSAIVLIPYCFFAKWLANRRLNICYVFPFILTIGIIHYMGYSKVLTLLLLKMLAYNQNDYVMYYIIGMENQSSRDVRVVELFYMFLAIAPLFYFTVLKKAKYSKDMYLRLSVNMTCFVLTWSSFFYNMPVITRLVDYFLWFEIWGFGYMIKDAFNSYSLCKSNIYVYLIVVFLCYRSLGKIDMYYANNNYMTVLSDECKKKQLYKRDLYSLKSKIKRVRN